MANLDSVSCRVINSLNSFLYASIIPPEFNLPYLALFIILISKHLFLLHLDVMFDWKWAIKNSIPFTKECYM